MCAGSGKVIGLGGGTWGGNGWGFLQGLGDFVLGSMKETSTDRW